MHVYDPDTVSEANMGRQLSGAFDVGQSMAHFLVNRINAFFGTAWEAHFNRYEGTDYRAEDIRSCVSTALARATRSPLTPKAPGPST